MTVLAKLLPDLPPRLAISIAQGRSLLRRRPLPPGDLIHLDVLERTDRRLLLTLADVHGPLFKGLSENRLLICVVGLPAGRRILKELSSALQSLTSKPWSP